VVLAALKAAVILPAAAGRRFSVAVGEAGLLAAGRVLLAETMAAVVLADQHQARVKAAALVQAALLLFGSMAHDESTDRRLADLSDRRAGKRV
jgi:hypothetical protein